MAHQIKVLENNILASVLNSRLSYRLNLLNSNEHDCVIKTSNFVLDVLVSFVVQVMMCFVSVHAMKTRPRPQSRAELTQEQMEVVLGQAEDDADMQVRVYSLPLY